MIESIHNQIQAIRQHFAQLQPLYPVLEKITRACNAALQNGRKIIWCGNGGSASQCQHLAAELVGRFAFDRPALNALALTTDTSALTAIGNDYGFDKIFERQLLGVGQRGDILFGLSTSGNSANVVQAFLAAQEMGITTVAFTGARASKLSKLADLAVQVPATHTARIQEMHLALGHIICGLIEDTLYGGQK
jgi:D-sedoheptulose 7-phosphate isomerase